MVGNPEVSSKRTSDENTYAVGSGRGPVEIPVKEAPKIRLTPKMKAVLTSIADNVYMPTIGRNGTQGRIRTRRALHTAGLVATDNKFGSEYVTVAGYKALGRKHPYE